MAYVVFWAFLFSVTTTASILLLGHRDLVSGDIGMGRMVRIIFDWRFIVGAILAFGARLLFILTNNAIYKIPALSSSSTTITTLINSGAIIMVMIGNYFFLKEQLSILQLIGASLVVIGIFLATRG